MICGNARAGRTLLLAAAAATLHAQDTPTAPLRDLDAPGIAYRTPRSGEGIRTTLFGSELTVPARDRRTVSAWQLGVDAALAADDNEALPFGSLYFWRRPDDRQLLRASLAGVYDTVFWAYGDGSGRELVVTFENYTLPWSTGELVDGVVDDTEQLFWGYVRAGVGVGVRMPVAPFHQENMLASDVVVEPGYSYFGRADTTAAGYRLPDSGADLRLRWITRYDAMDRNLLELPHGGLAIGADAFAGLGPRDRSYGEVTVYGFGIAAVPGLDPGSGERNRIYASLHAGVGDGVDRFTAQRVGGGPDLRGSEYETTARPWLPGAAYSEFFPEHYAIGSLGYRRELAFFAHLDLGGTLAWLDVDRQRAGGRARADETLVAVSARLSTGFVGRTLLQLGYAHNFDVVRDGSRGGDEFTVMVTGRF
ncbi:MAG: hypothetical protein KDE27_08120 [Planctomycetes bacterium]|nr:hypothetical protein [Planctomycetota bacterium]